MTEENVNRVSVTDVNIPFLSMVRFMVKWAIASIPALLILIILGGAFWSVLTSLVTSKSAPSAGVKTSVQSDQTLNPEVAAYLPKIEIRNIEVSKGTLGETGVFGEVKNMGDRSLKSVEITIYYLGADGKPIFEKQFRPVHVSEFGLGDENNPLKPGYARKFGIKLYDAPSDWSKKVDIRVTSVTFG